MYVDDNEVDESDGRKCSSYVFQVDWEDPRLGLTRKFLLTYYPDSSDVEMLDLKCKKPFLRRIKCETVEKSDFYLGNTVVIFSRRLLIRGYGNLQTENAVESCTEVTCAIIKSGALNKLGLLLDDIMTGEGFTIAKMAMINLNPQQAQQFYFSQREEENYKGLVEEISSGPIVAMELIGRNAVENWKRYLSGYDDDHNVDITASQSKAQAEEELSFFFPSDNKSKKVSPKSSVIGESSTCCIIKPHAFKSGLAGSIIRDIQSYPNLKITALQLFHLQYGMAEEFYEIYKGIVQDYTGMVRELSSGKCLVLEISGKDNGIEKFEQDIVLYFREVTGPSDPDLCRAIRPNSLRAKYGITKDQNAIHCTDLSEDGPLEIEYFFKILS